MTTQIVDSLFSHAPQEFLPPLAEPASVSIVMVVRNEAQHIRECLTRIAAQDYPMELLEIVIADGMSDDGTREIALAADTRGIPLSIVDNPDVWRPQGLNRAIRTANHDVILRVDARTIIETDYVSKSVRTLRETGAANVGGVQRPIAKTATQEAIGLAMANRFGVGNAQFRVGRKSGVVDTVYLGCFRREVFDLVGYFDESAAIISEDSEFNQRIREANGKVYLNTDISAYYLPRHRLSELWKQYFWYGGARAGCLIKHKKLTAWRQVVAPTFLLLLFASLLGSVWMPICLYLFSALVVSYMAANFIASSLAVWKARRIPLFLTLCLAFPCMHFAWAFGFWRRLLVPEKAGNYWAT